MSTTPRTPSKINLRYSFAFSGAFSEELLSWLISKLLTVYGNMCRVRFSVRRVLPRDRPIAPAPALALALAPAPAPAPALAPAESLVARLGDALFLLLPEK